MPILPATKIASDVKLGKFSLTAKQIQSVGKYEKLEVTVDLFKEIVENIRYDPLF